MDEGQTYTQVSAGWEYTVLLRNDGIGVACGLNDGQCVAYPFWMLESLTSRSQAKARQCFSEAMAMLPLVDGVLQDSIFRVSATTADIFVIDPYQSMQLCAFCN